MTATIHQFPQPCVVMSDDLDMRPTRPPGRTRRALDAIRRASGHEWARAFAIAAAALGIVWAAWLAGAMK